VSCSMYARLCRDQSTLGSNPDTATTKQRKRFIEGLKKITFDIYTDKPDDIDLDKVVEIYNRPEYKDYLGFRATQDTFRLKPLSEWSGMINLHPLTSCSLLNIKADGLARTLREEDEEKYNKFQADLLMHADLKDSSGDDADSRAAKSAANMSIGVHLLRDHYGFREPLYDTYQDDINLQLCVLYGDYYNDWSSKKGTEDEEEQTQQTANTESTEKNE
jgi:hypothetical protein